MSMHEFKIEGQFYPDGVPGKIRISKSYLFDLSDHVVPELPSDCHHCPVGYSTVPGHPCGRNVPFKPEDSERRPDTCKLRTLDQWMEDKEKVLWCDNQSIDEHGTVICLAHLVDGRVFNCPYRNEGDRLEAEYPCSDYKEHGKMVIDDFHRAVRDIRIAEGILLYDMAKHLRLTSAELSGIECGRRPIPDWFVSKLLELYPSAWNYKERLDKGVKERRA